MIHHYIPENRFPMEVDPAVRVLGNYFFNLFLVIGETHTALFEVGISATVDIVITQMESLGIEPDYIIPSHPHSDHITGLPGLVKRYPRAEGIRVSIETTIALIKKIQSSGLPDSLFTKEIFEENYKDEFCLYTPENIQNCAELLVKRARQARVQD